jgi:nitrite reductase/ring-hydroxylating ferredoxin subunit
VSRTANDLVDTAKGEISREIFVNEALYQEEKERIFARAWLYVGHESQIREPGDFFVSRMGEESVILTRDFAGKIHVFLNSCAHRGMKVCRYDQGNTKAFRCPYHAWTYKTDGTLLGVQDYVPKRDSRRKGIMPPAFDPPHLMTFSAAAPASFALGRARGGFRSDPALEIGDAHRQPFVLLARCLCHGADRLELLALHDVDVIEDALDLGLDQGIDLPAHALGGTGRIAHELGEFIEEA